MVVEGSLACSRDPPCWANSTLWRVRMGHPERDDRTRPGHSSCEVSHRSTQTLVVVVLLPGVKVLEAAVPSLRLLVFRSQSGDVCSGLDLRLLGRRRRMVVDGVVASGLSVRVLGCSRKRGGRLRFGEPYPDVVASALLEEGEGLVTLGWALEWC